MTTFAHAVENDYGVSLTANGMLTNASSLNPCVDLFFAIGSSRGKDLSLAFERAYLADASVAMRVLFWARDIRGGAGERGIFRSLLQHMETRHPEVLERVLHLVPEYGRWDDLLVFKNREFQIQAYSLINKALRTGNGLAAKWMPRKGPIAKALREYMNETPKGYRKLVVNLTQVVESHMCAREWDKIEYGHVPSVAAARYQKAFNKHDATRYAEYKEALTKGEAKINAAAVYPYDVIKSLKTGDATVAVAQWEALPNYLGDDKILPMVDVSGSMNCPVGGNANMVCMDVAISLGLYIADKQQGAFKDMWLTFSENSHIEILRGDLAKKVRSMRHDHVGYSTSIESAFRSVLTTATNAKVPAEEMPKYLLILSDMEFNPAVFGANIRAIDMVRQQYEAAGYALPRIVWWNLNAREGNVPVRFDEQGTALVSGFSPAILKNILAAKNFTPVDIMMDTINSERYALITEAMAA
jgi:hypothetical protein